MTESRANRFDQSWADISIPLLDNNDLSRFIHVATYSSRSFLLLPPVSFPHRAAWGYLVLKVRNVDEQCLLSALRRCYLLKIGFLIPTDENYLHSIVFLYFIPSQPSDRPWFCCFCITFFMYRIIVSNRGKGEKKLQEKSKPLMFIRDNRKAIINFFFFLIFRIEAFNEKLC